MPWIYKYIDGALEEIDMGHYDTKIEAESARDRHASFGAICSEQVTEVADDYELYKGAHADG